MQQEFTAKIQAKGKRKIIQLPFDPNTAWGIKERHDVTGTVNGFTFRGPLEQEDGSHHFALGPAWFRDSGLDTDATVTVVLSAEGPQIAAMDDDLQAAFAETPAAATFFNSLPTFYRKNYMRWIDSAKRPETRANRITEMIALLANEQRER